MTIDFDVHHERKHTSSLKWSYLDKLYKRDDIISMWVADSDFLSPKPIIDRLIERADHGIFGYTAKPQAFYDSFIGWVKKRHNWDIKQEWVIATPGIVPAINWAIHALTEEGDKIIIQPPVYYPFFSAVTANNRELVENTLIEEDDSYRMDFDGLLDVIDDRTKMIVLCNPHNPVGRVWREEELKKLGEICLEKGIIILSDEIHSDLVYDGHKHIPIASISEKLNKITMTCMAPSKTFNVAGLEASVTIISDETLRNKFKTFQSSIGMGMINIFGIEAFTACYQEGEEWLEAQLKYLKGNVDYFTDFVEKNLTGFKVTEMEGTYLLWLDCRILDMDTEKLKEFFVNKVKVGLVHGEMFGKSGRGFMRFNIATPRKNIEQVLSNLKEACTELGI
jgi:cystathionine beta-lyase